MVGKPNVPPDDRKKPGKGSARPTPGLTPLDQEREASMADEGGASGATVESEQTPKDTTAPPSTPGRPASSKR